MHLGDVDIGGGHTGNGARRRSTPLAHRDQLAFGARISNQRSVPH
jgi:hypothetical protein